MGPADYLRAFFQELSEQVSYSGYSHAVSFEGGSLCALLGVGDARVRIQLQDLDPDPKQAARGVLASWEELRKMAYLDDFVDLPYRRP